MDRRHRCRLGVAAARSSGSRCCALALPNARWVRACARRQSVQRQPLCQPADVPCSALVTARTLAGLYRSSWFDFVPAGHRFGSQPPWLDLILADGQRFGSQLGIGPRYRSSPASDGVIAQLEPLAGDFNELPSIVGAEPADRGEAARSLWSRKYPAPHRSGAGSDPGISRCTLNVHGVTVSAQSPRTWSAVLVIGCVGSARHIRWALGCDVLVEVEEVARIVGTLDLD
jgi:hypothetical protein